MAQNGMFRNAFRGFNKQEVLQFIDEITAAWDEERKALQATADEAVAAQEAMQAQAEEAQAQAAAAAEQLQTAEDLLKELQQKVTSTAEDLAVAATTIEEMALTKKQEDVFNNWLKEKIDGLYVYIAPDFRDGDFEFSNWVK
jgi:chromosome segregation ATPase